MKKKKTIRIKNQNLQNLRNNLRLILIRWAGEEMGNYTKKMEPLMENLNKNLDEFQALNKKWERINRMTDDSICICKACMKYDRNMTYSPTEKIWFCEECYEENKAFYRGKKEEKYFP